MIWFLASSSIIQSFPGKGFFDLISPISNYHEEFSIWIDSSSLSIRPLQTALFLFVALFLCILVPYICTIHNRVGLGLTVWALGNFLMPVFIFASVGMNRGKATLVMLLIASISVVVGVILSLTRWRRNLGIKDSAGLDQADDRLTET